MSIPFEQDAVAAARAAVLAGDPEPAVGALQAHIDAHPADHEARYWLASLCIALGDPALGEEVMNEARTLQALAAARSMGADLPRCKADPIYAAQVAQTLYGQRLVAMSSAVRVMELSGGGMSAQSLLSYGLALQHQGRVEEACQVFQAASETHPSAAVDQFGIFPQIFRENGARHFFEAAKAWAGKYARAPEVSAAAAANPPRAGRKLKIGYVAPSFAGTQLRQFIAPLLEHHDQARVEVTLYVTDKASEAGWPEGIRVRALGGLSDEAAAALIRGDGIDVLADCWGHTAGSRLPVFAHRPAPVQVAGMNFVQSTGLPQIDYVLHAVGGLPPDEADCYVEGVWSLGPVFCVFRPAPGRLPPEPTPALRTSLVTFGSFNHPAKLSEGVVATWAAILRAKADSRLLLKYGYFADPVLRRSVQARFAGYGVEPERIVFAGHSTGAEYFASFREVDLALDPWPAPGSTTTMEALSNGVPVLALDGPAATLGGAYARSILNASGLADLVADSPEDFVARALAVTADIAELDRLRERVRPGFDGGACCDEAGFTRRVEGAFEAMFDQWVAGAASRKARA